MRLLLALVLALATAAPAGAATFAYGTFEGIYRAGAGGGAHERVTPRDAHDPEISRDGRRLLYQRRYFELWTSRPDGGGARRILKGPGGRQIHTVAWSPDARRVAFEVVWEEDNGRRSRHAVYTARADGKGVRRLHDGMHPAWSPDGKLIAFATSRGVSVIRPDGRGHRRLREVPRLASDLEFSPDSRRLLYLEGAAPARIHVIDVRTRRDRALPQSKVGRPQDAAWASGGKRIAYLHQDVPPEGVWPPTVLYTIAPGGSGRRRVLTFPSRRWADSLSWRD